jgi:hypothetical protein
MKAGRRNRTVWEVFMEEKENRETLYCLPAIPFIRLPKLNTLCEKLRTGVDRRENSLQHLHSFCFV